MSVEAFRSCTADERSQAVRELAGLLNAVHGELLDLVLAVDAEEDWRSDGATGVAEWIEQMVDVDPRTARLWRRVARRLAELPHLREAFYAGRLSWDQIRVIVRFADPEDDAALAVELVGCSVAQLEAMARMRRRRTREDDATAERHRELTRRRDEDRGGVRYSFFLPDEDAESFDTAMDRDAEAAGADAETGMWAPIGRRRADAVAGWAAQRLGEDPNPDLATVVVHADADLLDALLGRSGDGADDPQGSGITADGLGSFSEFSVLRLLCDSRIEYVFHDTDGSTVGVAEASRTIPAWLRRVIVHRDLRCRFPGCNRRIRHLHHMLHWASGGRTDSDNLIGLCWHHHRLVHEGTPAAPGPWNGPWKITGNPDIEVTFHHPDGERTFTSTVRPHQTRRLRHRKRRVDRSQRTLRFHTSRDRAPAEASRATT